MRTLKREEYTIDETGRKIDVRLKITKTVVLPKDSLENVSEEAYKPQHSLSPSRDCPVI